MIYYTITSDERQMFNPPKPSILSKLEDQFMRLYWYYIDTKQDELAIKYLKYFNHVAAMRNRLEYGL